MTIAGNLSSARFIIAMAFVAMLILSFASFTRISRMNELSTLLNHSNIIKLKLQETYSDLSDADSELSKHILTSDAAYRENMMAFESRINASVKVLKSLTLDENYKAKKVSTLDSLIQKRFELMTEELQNANKDYSKITSAITDCNQQIISVITDLKQYENSALTDLETSVEQYKRWPPLMMFDVEVFVTLFLIFAYFRTDRELKTKRRLQNELEEQIRFVKAILDNSVDLILVLDTKSNLVVANKKSYELLKITDIMIGQNIFTLFPVGQNSKSHVAINQALAGEYVHIEKHKAHAINLVLESFFVPLYKAGAVSAVMIIHHDISALVKASEELEVRNEQLLKSNLELEQFAYVASHDLQEPLRKVMTYSGLAEAAKNDPEKLSGYLSKISISAGRMLNLIKDVLDFSRASFKASETQSVDLNEIFRHVLGDLELIIEEKMATINAVHLPFIDGHAQQLSQVFFNLIHNALKFCDKPPVITLHCKTENGFYIISISDNGIGFDQSYQDDIFQVFKRIPNKTDYAGTGIGLAVCKKIISNHNGEISVRSKPGEGTTFEIRLPIPRQQTNNSFSSPDKTSGIRPTRTATH